MKFIIAIGLTALLGFALPLFSFMPWWTFAFGSFIVALVIQQKPWKAFAAGFLGLFLLWCLHAMIIDFQNDHILSQRIAAILPLGGSSFLLILVSALLGGLISGFAALTGSLLYHSLFPPVTRINKREEATEDSLV